MNLNKGNIHCKLESDLKRNEKLLQMRGMFQVERVSELPKMKNRGDF